MAWSVVIGIELLNLFSRQKEGKVTGPLPRTPSLIPSCPLQLISIYFFQERKSIRVLCMAVQRRVWEGQLHHKLLLEATVSAAEVLKWADNMWQHRVPLGKC